MSLEVDNKLPTLLAQQKEQLIFDALDFLQANGPSGGLEHNTRQVGVAICRPMGQDGGHECRW